MTTDTPDALVVTLTDVIDGAVRQLGDRRGPVEASRLAARAWSALRHDFPDQAERLNRTMHYLARREADLQIDQHNQTDKNNQIDQHN